MGSFLSSLLGWIGGGSKVGVMPQKLGPEADIPDPTSSLTPREVLYVKSTWRLVKPDLRGHGIKLFILLFETHPHLKQKFKSFCDKSIEELLHHKRLAAHATTVMTALDSYVESLDDPSIVIEMLKTTGHNHKNRGITKEDFELLYPVLLKYLGEALGSALSVEATKAWTHLTKVIHSIIITAFD